MDRIQTTDHTHLSIAFTKDMPPSHISILSERTWKFILRKSLHDEWWAPVTALIPTIDIGSYSIVGFQPNTGNFIVIKERN